MYSDVLKSEVVQTVRLGSARIEFDAGELLHTENSFKYDEQQFLELARAAGFECDHYWSDEREWFSMFLLRVC